MLADGLPRFDAAKRVLIDEDGVVEHYPNFLDTVLAPLYFEALIKSVPWQNEEFLMFGRRVMAPRKVCWFGDAGAVYTYSRVMHTPEPWIPPLPDLRTLIEVCTGAHFNSVLVNLYRDGQDSVGWHADDEPELGNEPAIASLSLGAARLFALQHRQTKRRVNVVLNGGSLLVMRGALQHCWRHCVPKTALPVSARINLTYRLIRITGVS